MYTVEKVEAFGNRLHINTVLAIIVNSIAAYLVLKHSTAFMKVYKYYILSTIFFAFLMDFHITFIFGLFPLFLRVATCPAGIAKSLGPFWGETVQYAAIHFTLSFCGLSIFFGIVYQYLSFVKNNNFLQTPQGAAFVAASFLIYPLPAFILHLPGIDYSSMITNIQESEPDLLPFFVAASCNGRLFTNLTVAYLIVGIVQNFVVNFIAVILGYKIYKKLKNSEIQMSSPTLKITRQFFVVLSIQMAIPLMFIMVPIGLIATIVIFKIENSDAFNQALIQILSFHSVANALAVMFVIKPYRQILYSLYGHLFCLTKKSSNSIGHLSTAFDAKFMGKQEIKEKRSANVAAASVFVTVK